MMRSLFFCLSLLFTITLSFGQTTEQSADKANIARVQNFYNTNKPDSLVKYFDPIMKSGLPADKLGVLFTQMKTQLGTLKQTSFMSYEKGAAIYKGEFQNDVLLIVLSVNSMSQINGLYFKANTPAAAMPDKPKEPVAAAKPGNGIPVTDPSLTESPILLKTLGGPIAGTLTVPKNATGKIPVVLIVPGSGLTDRDGNSAPGNTAYTYKLIANSLGEAGIACLRYDKRGAGQSKSTAKEEDTKFTDHVNDVSALIISLREDDRFSKVIVLGHSDGSLSGMIAAFSEHVDGFIAVGASGLTADKMLLEQIKKTKAPAVADEFKTITDSLRKGKTVPRVDPALYYVARPGLQNYLMNWMIFDPTFVIHKIKIPIIIIQGTTDLQASVTDAEKLKKARSEAQLKIIEGMNHVLKAAPDDVDKNLATYTDPSLPLMPEFVNTVVGFIKGLK